jgi:hypothetical protein
VRPQASAPASSITTGGGIRVSSVAIGRIIYSVA